MSFDIDRLLRSLKPEKHTAIPPTRSAAQLRADSAHESRRPIVLDTTAYVHAGQGRLPTHIATMIALWPLQHCSVALAEIAHGIGRLDPAHPGTRRNKAFLENVLRQIPQHRVVTPSDDQHIAAGILTGVIARLLNLTGGGHHARVNDALIFLVAQKVGAAVVTANVADFDILQQLVPSSHVIYY